MQHRGFGTENGHSPAGEDNPQDFFLPPSFPGDEPGLSQEEMEILESLEEEPRMDEGFGGEFAVGDDKAFGEEEDDAEDFDDEDESFQEYVEEASFEAYEGMAPLQTNFHPQETDPPETHISEASPPAQQVHTEPDPQAAKPLSPQEQRAIFGRPQEESALAEPGEPAEPDPPVELLESNVFTPISVADRLRNVGKYPPTSRPAAMPMMRPGQRYGLGFSHLEEPQPGPYDGPGLEAADEMQSPFPQDWGDPYGAPSPENIAQQQAVPPQGYGVEYPYEDVPPLPPESEAYGNGWEAPVPLQPEVPVPLSPDHDVWSQQEPGADAWDAWPGDPASIDQSPYREEEPFFQEEVPEPGQPWLPMSEAHPQGGGYPEHGIPNPSEGYPPPEEDEEEEPEATRASLSSTLQKQKDRARARLGAAFATPAPQPDAPKPSLFKAIATVVALVLLVVCLVALGRMVLTLMQNESEMKSLRAEYRQASGGELNQEAARVELLPQGQTFTPTATPEPRATTGSAAIAALGGQEATQDPSVPAENQRNKTTRYEENPLGNVLEPFVTFQKENPDIMARLTIGTLVDQLVVQRNNTYYLTHNAYGAVSSPGAVFIAEGYQLKRPPENLLLRGQSTFNGKLLNPLLYYASGDAAFVRQNAIIRLDTLYEEAQYVLIAVIHAKSDPSDPGYFNYGGYATFQSDRQMESFVVAAREHSLYEIPVDVQPFDRLLTIATVGDGDDTSALVLMARKLRTGETESSLSNALGGIKAY